jgi:hypothetical protein
MDRLDPPIRARSKRWAAWSLVDKTKHKG